MFIGHYGPGFAIKPAAPQAPMWALLGATQIMDVVWAVLIELGVEHGRVDPAHALAGSALVLDDMPYTHSLLGAAVICLAFAALARATIKNGSSILMVWIFLAGMSHWLLDLVVHAPDLTLAGAPPKLGFGLWAYRWPEFALELALLAGGFGLYLRATSAKGPIGRAAPWLMLTVMMAAAFYDKLSPIPDPAPADAMKTSAGTALAAFLTFMAGGAWLDHVRAARAPG